MSGKKSEGKIDMDLDFGHEHWRGRGILRKMSEEEKNRQRHRRNAKKFAQIGC